MKTYAESNNKTPFDWNTFLKNAIRRKSEMPDEDHDNAIKLSGEWVTCACGNQCDILERDERGEPLDEELMELGSDFHDYICYKDWKEAKETLKSIEARSAKLINEKMKAMILFLKSCGYNVTKK